MGIYKAEDTLALNSTGGYTREVYVLHPSVLLVNLQKLSSQHRTGISDLLSRFRNETITYICLHPRIHFSWIRNFMLITQIWNKGRVSACWNKKNLLTTPHSLRLYWKIQTCFVLIESMTAEIDVLVWNGS